MHSKLMILKQATAPNTITTKLKSGREYIIEQDDTYYKQHFGHTALHYQKKNFMFAYSLLHNPRTIVDVGMNVGMNTIEYGTFAKNVIGFEPTPWVFNWANKNIAWNTNNVDHSKPALLPNKKDITAHITTHNVGLSNCDKKQETFFSNPRNNGHNSIANMNKNFRKDTVKYWYKADVVTLDSYSLDCVDFIKIDVEGGELPVLQGAVNTIAKNRPILQCEVVVDQCKDAYYTPKDLWEFLCVQRNYRAFTHDGVERKIGDMSIVKNKILWNNVKPYKMMDYFFIPAEKTNP